MNNKRESLKIITRGGQTFLHNLRMINQVLNKVLIWSAPFPLLIVLLWLCLHITPYQREVFSSWLEAKLAVQFGAIHHMQVFHFREGDRASISAIQLVNAPLVRGAVETICNRCYQALIGFLWGYGFSVVVALICLQYHGRRQSQEKRLKGDYLGTPEQINKMIRKRDKISNLTIGRVMMPQFSEMQHYLFHGTTGSGKSTAIKAFLDLIRSRGDRAIIYDKSCSFVKEYYQEDQDILMNCLDQRGAPWDLWKECRDKTDFDSLAAALIPSGFGNQDPFWVNAARTIFSAAAYRMHDSAERSLLKLLRFLLTANIETLQLLLRGTEAESLMSDKAEKTAVSIKSVLATYLKSLCFITEGKGSFSIRQWVQNDQSQGWLFISSQGDKHESIKPLITAWLDIAVNSLLSLAQKSERRIWIVLDELASLQQLPYLTTALSEARKFGGCFIIGIQSYAQLAKVYGHDGGREISSLLNTRFMFRIPDPDIAQWSARNLGETLMEEVREGISYGANTMRDGVSINRVERSKPVVHYSEIMLLPDLNCYLRLPGAYPIVRLALSYQQRGAQAKPLIPRILKPTDLSAEVEKLVDTHATVVQKNETPSTPSVIPAPVTISEEQLFR